MYICIYVYMSPHTGKNGLGFGIPNSMSRRPGGLSKHRKNRGFWGLRSMCRHPPRTGVGRSPRAGFGVRLSGLVIVIIITIDHNFMHLDNITDPYDLVLWKGR